MKRVQSFCFAAAFVAGATIAGQAIFAGQALIVGQAAAEPQHGVAMHGAPKYSAGFSHLEYTDPKAPKGGEIRFGVTGSFDSLQPFIIKGRAAAGRHFVFESLLKRVWDEPFSMYGLIAETVEMPSDRNWVEFKLHSDARWHDGTPIMVEDVIWSMETLRDQGRPNHKLFYSKVIEVTRPAPNTVRFDFGPDNDDRELALLMGLMPVLSKNHFADREFNETTLEPILGSGPYRIADVDPGRSIEYERVTDYWAQGLGVNAGQNNFDRIKYDYFLDGTVLFEAFKADEYDFRSEFSATRWAIGYDFPAVDDGRVVKEMLENDRPSGMRGFVFNTRREVFADRAVREALSYAFDFEWVNKNLLHGAYTRSESFFANSELASNSIPQGAERALLEPHRGAVPGEVFLKQFSAPKTDGTGNVRANLRKALALLRAAGWNLKDGALTRGSDGLPMTFEILLVSPSNEKIALAYARNLERIGVIAKVRTVDSAQYQGRRTAYDYDMIIFRWGISLSPGNEQAFYWGSEAADQDGSRNYMGAKDPVMDDLILRVTMADDRIGLVTAMRALDRVLLWNHYVVPLYYLESDRAAYWDRFGHPATTSTYGNVIESWWEDPKKLAANPR
jgi:microcin C transport system substrate-binding protein